MDPITFASALLFGSPLAGLALLAKTGPRDRVSVLTVQPVAPPLAPRPSRPFELSDLGTGRADEAYGWTRLPEPFASAPFWEAASNDYAPAAARGCPACGRA